MGCWRQYGLFGPSEEQGDKYGAREMSPARGHVCQGEHGEERSSGKAQHPGLALAPHQAGVVEGGHSGRQLKCCGL